MKNGKYIFLYNYVKVIEELEIERGDKINFTEFGKNLDHFSYICYPAFRLQ